MHKLVHKKTGLEISRNAILNKPNMLTAGVMCGAIGCIPSHPLTVPGIEGKIINSAIRMSLDEQGHSGYVPEVFFHGYREDMHVDLITSFNRPYPSAVMYNTDKPKPYKINAPIGIGSLEGFSGSYASKATILYNPTAHYELTSIARRNLAMCELQKMFLNLTFHPLLILNENYHLDSFIEVLENKTEIKIYRVYSKTLELIFSNIPEGVGFKKYSRGPVLNYTASWLKYIDKKYR